MVCFRHYNPAKMPLLRRFRTFTAIITASIVTAAVLFGPQLALTANAKKAADTQPPTAPTNLVATNIGQTSVTLSWTASTDNKGITGYSIYKNATYLSSTTTTTITVSGLTAGTVYSFYVKAKDYSGNLSAASNTLNVTTAAVPAPTPTPTPTPTPAPAPMKIVAGYYASWSAYNGYTPLNIPAANLTVINYAFAGIGSDLKIAMGDPAIDPTNFSQLQQLKKSYPAVKTIISIGGWEDSGRFSDAALTDASRAVFADSVVAFIKQYGFNGVDIDWEYPVSGGLTTNVKRPEDKTNFTLLLNVLRQKLDAQGAVDGQKYLLTIAGGADTSYANNTELSQIANIVDYASVMTYDIHGSWDSYTDLNAPLYTPTESSPQYKWSADAAVKTWVAHGFPASKLIMGVPFYGYIYSGVSGGGNGLYKTFSSAASISYDSVLAKYLNTAGYTKYTHQTALVPWLFNGSTFISYDDVTSITAKVGYIKTSGLAGASVWELSQNKNGVLLDALYSNLK